MINIDALNDDEKLAALESIHKSIAESKEIQKKKITTNVELIVKALKKIESDLKQRYDETGQLIANLKNGEDGRDGKDGKDGKNGRDGRDGPVGPRGYDGLPGRNGIDGTDGVSVTDAHIDFDGSLIISLSSGRVINVGEVVAADIAEKIKVITNGGGTSQGVLDAIASLQAQIDSIASGLEYQGTWNASTNVPTLASSVGTAGYYYIVATAGSTNLNGVTDWQVGDWAVFNGSVWQKIDQTNLVTSVAGRTGAVVLTTADIGGLGTIATQAASNVSITGGSIAGITDLAIADGGTGQSTAAAAITALTGTQTSGYYLRSNGTSASLSAISAGDVPTLNQNTTGTAAGLSATLATSSGGTGLTSFTADGVPYATSTSVLATSGLLKFQATNSALTVAATTTSNGYVGFTNSADGGTQGYIGDAKALITPGINSALAVRGEDAILFGIASTEGMRLNSTGLGIGKTAGSALDVKGTLRLSGSTSGYVGLAPAAAAGSTTYILPSADGTSGQSLVTDGSGTLSWASGTGGTVTSVAASVPTFLSIAGSPITSSGTLAITLSGTALPTTSGGTGLTSFTANGVVYASSTSALATGSSLTFNGSTFGVNYSIASNYKFYVSRGGTAGELVAFTDGTAQTLTIDTAASSILINSPNGGALAFGVTTEQMRLTSTGLGIGTSSPSTKLVVSGTTTALDSNGQILATVTDAVAADKGGQIMMGGYYTGTTPTAFAGIAGKKENGTSGSFSGYLQFLTSTGGTGNTEKARIDSAGNFGIGTSSPASALDVKAANAGQGIRLTSTTGTNGVSYKASNSAGNVYFGIDTSTGGTFGNANNAVIWYDAAYPLIFATNNSKQMTIDSSGNLGLGVTPSAWGTAYRTAIQVGAAACFSGTSGSSATDYFAIGGNFYLNSSASYRYITTAAANRLEASAGEFRFYNAPTGTAGNAITFTQAMTLDASGNLGIGVTSPASKLDVLGDIRSYANGDNNGFIGSSGGTHIISLTRSTNNAKLAGYDGIVFFTNATTLSGGSERARIDSSGRFGIGVTPSAWGSGYKVLQIGNAGFMNSGASTWFYNNSYFDGTNNIYTTTAAATRYVQASGAHNWDIAASGTAGTSISFTQAMTLDASGNLGIGTTSFTNSSGGAKIGSSGRLEISSTTTSSSDIAYWRNANGIVGAINISGSTTTYATSSDYRLKNTIAPMTGALDKVALLKPCTYKWNADGSDGEGFIAHELAEVVPQCVTGDKDAVDEEGNPKYQGIDTSFLVAILTAALQEAVAKINSLEARLDAANL